MIKATEISLKGNVGPLESSLPLTTEEESASALFEKEPRGTLHELQIYITNEW